MSNYFHMGLGREIATVLCKRMLGNTFSATISLIAWKIQIQENHAFTFQLDISNTIYHYTDMVILSASYVEIKQPYFIVTA